MLTTAQTTLSYYTNSYTYDAAGNRKTRTLISVSYEKNGSDTSSVQDSTTIVDSTNALLNENPLTHENKIAQIPHPNVYPNPTSDYLTIDLKALAIDGVVTRTFVLYDSKHTAVVKFESTLWELNIPMQAYASGKYTLHILSSKSQFKYNIIKQ
jgi:hypothetical protein